MVRMREFVHEEGRARNEAASSDTIDIDLCKSLSAWDCPSTHDKKGLNDYSVILWKR